MIRGRHVDIHPQVFGHDLARGLSAETLGAITSVGLRLGYFRAALDYLAAPVLVRVYEPPG